MSQRSYETFYHYTIVKNHMALWEGPFDQVYWNHWNLLNSGKLKHLVYFRNTLHVKLVILFETNRLEAVFLFHPNITYKNYILCFWDFLFPSCLLGPNLSHCYLSICYKRLWADEFTENMKAKWHMAFNRQNINTIKVTRELCLRSRWRNTAICQNLFAVNKMIDVQWNSWYVETICQM